MIRKYKIISDEVEIKAVRSQGAGGQNVNKVSTAAHLRFDIRKSSLPDEVKKNLLEFSDQRISESGVIIIKAQHYRSLEKNKQDALDRLDILVKKASRIQKKRKPTKPSRASKLKRLEGKTRRSRTKSLRGRIHE